MELNTVLSVNGSAVHICLQASDLEHEISDLQSQA
jgi:hypothetical protein